MTNENIDPIYAYIDNKIDERINHESNLLDDKILAIQRVLVETRAQFLTEQILSHEIVLELDKLKNIWYRRKYKRVISGINAAFSTLKGKLGEEALPEDAYRHWLNDIRTILKGSFTSDQVDLLLFQSSLWEKMMGIFEDD